MQFRDLKAQYQRYKNEIDAAIQRVLSGANFIGGGEVAELEEQLAAYVGVKHCLTCANGTEAMTLVLMAWGITAGDAVFVPDFTFFATGEVVAFRGATPVFVDVVRDTFNLDPAKLEKAIQRIVQEGRLTPKAVIPVDLFGLPANYPEIEKIADKYNLLVLEDGAQGMGGHIKLVLEDDDRGTGSHIDLVQEDSGAQGIGDDNINTAVGKGSRGRGMGSNFNAKRACSFGHAATTSFFPAKPLGCYGDGGAIFTDDDGLAELIQSLKVHGKGENKYDNVKVGLNSRLDALQAAILKVKLKALIDHELEDVNRIYRLYNEKLKDLEGIVEIPLIPAGYYSSFAQYTIKLKNKEQRDNLQAKLKRRNIPSMIYYPKPMHKQGAFSGSELEYGDNDFAITNELCEIVLSLPMHPYLKEKDVTCITEAIHSIF